MKLSILVQATLGSFCLLPTDGLPVAEVGFPQIIGPERVKIKAYLGQRLSLQCRAHTNFEADQTLIYWLVNDQFPEDAPSQDRIVETEESTLELQNGAVLQRSLLLKRVTSDDLKSTFTCVVTNAAGTIQKYTSLVKFCDLKAKKTRNYRQ